MCPCRLLDRKIDCHLYFHPLATVCSYDTGKMTYVSNVCSLRSPCAYTSSFHLPPSIILCLCLEYHHQYGSGSAESIPCPFLRIRWLRLVVDEGHEMTTEINGKNSKTSTGTASGGRRKKRSSTGYSQRFKSETAVNDTLSNNYNSVFEEPSTQFIAHIAAERRWIMSGTPTVGSQSRQALTQLQRLLCFLRHPVYGAGKEGMKQWKQDIVDPFLGREQRGLKTTLLVHGCLCMPTVFAMHLLNALSPSPRNIPRTTHPHNTSSHTTTPTQHTLSPPPLKPPLSSPSLGLDALVTLLKTVLVRHSKEDLKLHEPLRSRMDLDPLYEVTI